MLFLWGREVKLQAVKRPFKVLLPTGQRRDEIAKVRGHRLGLLDTASGQGRLRVLAADRVCR
ncbi:hypothetical protein BB934_23920 [Microvirga ossetica]|uniref:Uncharacterized protein n=1 Tax=Microvirga ossetica TaxID=1882682 RepID=A0A1B2ELS7_9HYPH|nr:hypothetical protein BB934_23920 [Microvirga ossetica]